MNSLQHFLQRKVQRQVRLRLDGRDEEADVARLGRTRKAPIVRESQPSRDHTRPRQVRVGREDLDRVLSARRARQECPD